MEYFCQYLSIAGWERQASHGDPTSGEEGFLASNTEADEGKHFVRVDRA
jgi:hypothetical protein